MLPGMTIKTDTSRWRVVTLPDGRRAKVTTRTDPDRGRIVIVKPLKN
jgi:hypothetical protein